MAVLAPNVSGHLQSQLTRSLERILEEANQSGELRLSNRKLRDFPKAGTKYNLGDTVIADLSKNRFSELPEEVTGFYFLERLHCYHNAIRYIPETVSGLQCLSHLDLSRNQLTTLPREICQLPIQILLVSNNRLSSLPDELCRMCQLTELDASCNQLTHLPPRMGELNQLQSLILRSNLLLCVPVELTYLQLARLDLRANRIGTLPVEMRNMESLIDLLVDENPLTSPPASLCRRGRVHIFKYLENEAIRLGHKVISSGSGTLGRRPTRKSVTSGSGSATPVPPGAHIPERLKHKARVDSGYSTSSDDKRWSQEIAGEMEKHWAAGSPVASRSSTLSQNGGGAGACSIASTPSTISPGPDTSIDDDLSKSSYSLDICDKKESPINNVRINPCTDNSNLTNSNGDGDKGRPLQQIQTYREYKEALKQQRAQDVGAVYRTKDNDEHGYKTEPNTPTHQATRTTLATSRSDPTPLNSALSSPRHVFDDTGPRKPVQKVTPSRNAAFSPTHANSNNVMNGNGLDNGKKYIEGYVKPCSPMKVNTGILSHDNVPPTNGLSNGKPTSPRIMNGSSKTNGVKTTGRSISWNKDMPPDKMTFTMRREIDKAREETDLINQLRTIIETRLKMSLPDDLAPTLTDGVVLCHLANQIKPRSVASIHVPSPAVPKLTMARCRRNVDNFIEACRKIGVDEERLCSSIDVTEALEGRGLPRLLDTVDALCALERPPDVVHHVTAATSASADAPQPTDGTTVSLLLLALLVATACLLYRFPDDDVY